MKKITITLYLTLGTSSPLFAQPMPENSKTGEHIDAEKVRAKTDKKVVGIPGTAFLRILNAMPIAGTVDIYDGAQKVGSGLKFKAITQYVEIKSGKSNFKVVGTGKNEPAIVIDSANTTRGKYYTLSLYGKQAASLLMVNDSSGKAALDKVRVRVIHLSPGAPALTVTAPSDRTVEGYAKFITKPIEYGKMSSKITKLTTLKLQFRTEDSKIIKETGEFKLEAGKRYDVFAIGEIGKVGIGTFDVILEPAAP